MSYKHSQSDDETLPPVVLYDGMCKLCNRSLKFILGIDRQGRLKFASLQSNYGRTILTTHGRHTDPMDTLMLLEGSRLSTKSTALIRIAKYLGGVWPLAIVAFIIPRFMRDAAYDVLARNRYSIYGKHDTCPLPDSEFEDRFYK